jgi:FkbM family methyltransferase
MHYRSLISPARYATAAIKYLTHDAKLSYSQNGEDILMAKALKGLKRKHITYLDIGAHAPIALSNTYLFYRGGHRGVTIEPNPALYIEHRKLRPRDVCLNVGIALGRETEMDYYMFEDSVMNTFSKMQLEHLIHNTNYTAYQTRRLPMMPVNAVLDHYFTSAPNVVSLDTEGADLDILQTWDFSKWRPDLFCVETITYEQNATARKLTEIVRFMSSNRYSVYADTHINTVFLNDDSNASR